MRKTQSKTKEFETASEFEALPDSEKERIYQELDAQSPQERLAKFTPLDARIGATAEVRAQGRPAQAWNARREGDSLSVEQGLLKRADRYAKSHGLKRAELFTKAIMSYLPEAG